MWSGRSECERWSQKYGRREALAVPSLSPFLTPRSPPSSLQCLAMLRILVCNPESHQILVDAKVIPAIVKQVGEEGLFFRLKHVL